MTKPKLLKHQPNRKIAGRRNHSLQVSDDEFIQMSNAGEYGGIVITDRKGNEHFVIRKTHRGSGWRLSPAMRVQVPLPPEEFLDRLKEHDPPFVVRKSNYNDTYVWVSYADPDEAKNRVARMARRQQEAALGMGSDYNFDDD